MSTFLEKLKARPIPQREKPVLQISTITQRPDITTERQDIATERQDITTERPTTETQKTKPIQLQAKIQDKTKDAAISRDEFLKKISKKLLVKPQILESSKPKLQQSDTIDTPVIVKPQDIKFVREDKPTKSTEEVPTKPTIIKKKISKNPSKKLLKKIKLKPKNPTLPYVKPLDKPVTSYTIGDTSIKDRLQLQKEEKIKIKASDYYLSNREKFINFINTKFLEYRDDIIREENEEVSCNKKVNTFNLLTHQKIIRDYINIYTPYRGLLIYHGLGSGKTCASIAITEGIKNNNKVIVMTPASLRPNYIAELKHCGDILYKKNQYWEFVSTEGNEEYTSVLSELLSISLEFIKKNNGAWLVNLQKPSNYNELTTQERVNLENQLNEMINAKYSFINYNGIRDSHLNVLTKQNKINPFDNSVVIVDEAHNFVSRIVNKLKNTKSLSYKLYEYLLSAQNCRIVFLSGTPIINYPNEIGVLFNILRGYIKTFTLPLKIDTHRKVDEKEIKKILVKMNILDYIEYTPSSKQLIITRNPLGFISNFNNEEIYSGVKLNQDGQINDNSFINIIVSILNKHNINVDKRTIKTRNYKALPDNLDVFNDMFINMGDGSLKNINLFKRRVVGLTSYFRSAQEQLMPRFNKETDLHVLLIPMSDYQLGVYENARGIERDLEKKSKKKKKKKKDGDDIFKEASSLYRIYSRSFCNFVFPRTIPRPYPNEDQIMSTNINEDILDNATIEDRINDADGCYTEEDREKLEKEKEEKIDNTYEKRIDHALISLKENEKEYLSVDGLKIYSPKYLSMITTINSPENKGLNLVYSQLRTLEGIGIFKLVLEANGYAHFKLKKTADNKWTINIKDSDKGKPTFALHTGTETFEEKEIIKNVFNGTWEYVPSEIRTELEKISSNNNYGEIIKVLMITSSGAEGISLKNVRFVHIMEPYWHPVRTEQVIGRARRICSHDELNEEDKTVEVFLYLMEFSKSQLDKTSKVTLSKELRLHDVSRIDSKNIITSDQHLYEVSNIKEDINKQILKTIKESSIDCAVYGKNNKKEDLKCFSFSGKSADKFSFIPNIEVEEKDKLAKVNIKTVTWKAQEITADGKKYAYKKDTKEVYDYESYINSTKDPQVNPILIGKLEKNKEGKTVIKFV